MSRILIEVPGAPDSSIENLQVNEAVVIGRAPDTSKVAVGGAREIRAHVVSSPSVSATHVVVRRMADGLTLQDLGSRNGSWIRLSREPVLVPDTECQIRLGFPLRGGGGDLPLESPDYSDDNSYGLGLARVVESWLIARRVEARVRVGRMDGLPGSVQLPLPTGDRLLIEATQTVDERFHDLLVPVARHVALQNTLYAAEQNARSDGMVLASDAIREVHRRVVGAALQSTARVLLLGPSGTGKELLARAYHRHLGVAGPLVTVNCATLSRDRIVADLFGAEAGAYTGAQRAVVGAVERADGGTLFLDEVGEMPLDVQSQLLRFLDTGEYQRLGATGLTRNASVHVVAATNRDLRAMVKDGAFRLDLFYRLALEVVEVPPLRERFDDGIAYLATRRLGDLSALEAMEEQAIDSLRRHSWPGNFRELLNFAQRLPRSVLPRSLDVTAVRKLLGAGVLSAEEAVPTAPVQGQVDWQSWVHLATDAFNEAQEGRPPATWADVTTFIEQYLKPYALVHLANIADSTSADSIVASKVAEAVGADRGTVVKQLRRYLESKRR